MGLALTVARKSLLERPGRTLFSTLGIAMGIATVVAVVVLDHNTILGLSAPYLREGGPDIELRAPGDRLGDARTLSEIEGVSVATRTFRQDAVVRAERPQDERGGKRRVQLVAIDAQIAPELGVYRVAQGRDLQPNLRLDPRPDPRPGTGAGAGRPEVLVGTELAEALDLEPGASLWISRLVRPGKKRCEDGVLVEVEGPPDRPSEHEFEVVGVITRERLGRRGSGMVVVIDFEAGEEVYRGVRVDRRWWARRDSGVDVERLKTTLSRSYSYVLDKSAILGQAADERAFRTGVRMAGLLALVLGLYVIFHTLSMSLTERIGEVGTLSALGTTRSQLARVFLLEAGLLAGGGALLGALGGVALARLLLALGITTLGTGKHVELFVVPWGTVLSLASLGMVIALVGSVYPLVTLRGASAAQALRGGEALERRRTSAGFHLLYALLLALVVPSIYFVVVPVVGELTAELVAVLLGAVGFLALLVVLSLLVPTALTALCSALTRPLTALWPFAGRMAARAIRDAPARIGVSASALALVSAGVVGLKGMTRSLEGEVRQWAGEAVRHKVWVRGMPPTDFSALAEHLHRYPGVLGVEKGNARVHSPFLVMGVAVSELARYGPCAQHPDLLETLEQGRGMILSRRLARDLDYRVGDPVQLARADGRVEELRVAAISDAYGHYPYPDERMYGLVADHLMELFYCIDVDTVSEVAVRLDSGTDPGTVEAAVFDFHGGPHEIHLRAGSRIEADHVADIRRDFVLFDVLLALTAVLAGLGVLNGQLLAALERTVQVGVLKALGASRRQMAGVGLVESAVVGLVGGALGAALGALGLPVVIVVLGRLTGLALPQVGPGPWVWIALGGSLAVALLSGLYPIWRTNRIDAVRAVRTG